MLNLLSNYQIEISQICSEVDMPLLKFTTIQCTKSFIPIVAYVADVHLCISYRSLCVGVLALSVFFSLQEFGIPRRRRRANLGAAIAGLARDNGEWV